MKILFLIAAGRQQEYAHTGNQQTSNGRNANYIQFYKKPMNSIDRKKFTDMLHPLFQMTRLLYFN